MSDCAAVQDKLVEFAEGGLNPAESGAASAHIAGCARCRAELDAINSIRGMLADQDLFAPEQNYTWQKLPETLAATVASVSEERQVYGIFGRIGHAASGGLRAWTVAMATVLVLVLVLVSTDRTAGPPSSTRDTVQVAAPGNEAFVSRIQTEYAREATAKYLLDCQDLLLTVVRAEKSCDGTGYDVSLGVDRARELLARKRLLLNELDAPEVAKAKDLCDELEHFLVNLSTAEKCESPDRLQHMEKFIRTQHLLLRINVLQSELS